MSPVHIRAKKGDVASNVIVAGDPGRVRLLSRLLEDSKTINANRGFLAITGRRGNADVTLAAHGIGGPSAAIVLEELIGLGATNVVRLGTAGGLTVNPGYYIVAKGAAHAGGGLYEQYLGRVAYPAAADPGLHLSLLNSLRGRGLPAEEGIVYSSDAFYAEGELTGLAKLGIAGVEMECGAILTVAALRGVKAGCVLMVSNKLGGRFLPSRALNDMAIKAGEAIMDALTHH